MGRNRGRPGTDDGGVADAGRRPLPDIAHGEHPHRLIDAAQQFIDEQRLRQVETEPRGEIRMAIEFQRLVPPPRSNHTAGGAVRFLARERSPPQLSQVRRYCPTSYAAGHRTYVDSPWPNFEHRRDRPLEPLGEPDSKLTRRVVDLSIRVILR